MRKMMIKLATFLIRAAWLCEMKRVSLSTKRLVRLMMRTVITKIGQTLKKNQLAIRTQITSYKWLPIDSSRSTKKPATVKLWCLLQTSMLANQHTCRFTHKMTKRTLEWTRQTSSAATVWVEGIVAFLRKTFMVIRSIPVLQDYFRTICTCFRSWVSSPTANCMQWIISSIKLIFCIEIKSKMMLFTSKQRTGRLAVALFDPTSKLIHRRKSRVTGKTLDQPTILCFPSW